MAKSIGHNSRSRAKSTRRRNGRSRYNVQKPNGTISKRVKNPRDPLSTDQAAALFMAMRKDVEEQAELTTWRRIKRLPILVAEHWVVGLIGTAAGGVAVAVWHWLTTLHH